MTPIYDAIGRWLGEYFAELVPMTPQVRAFMARPLDKAVVMVPGRMVDSAQDMLNLWVRNDSNGGPTTPAAMPIILVAVAQDMTPTGADYTKQDADPIDVVIPGDPKERAFKLRTMAQDYRVQLVFAAMEIHTAHSLAAQFALYVDTPRHKTLDAYWRFAGLDIAWPVKLESPDVAAMRVPTESKNLTMLALDLTLKATIPLYQAPRDGEPNDGKGSGTEDDPHGYKVMQFVYTESRLDGNTNTLLSKKSTDESGTTPAEEGAP